MTLLDEAVDSHGRGGHHHGRYDGHGHHGHEHHGHGRHGHGRSRRARGGRDVAEVIEAELIAAAGNMMAVLIPPSQRGQLMADDDVPEGVDVAVRTSRARCADGNGTLTHLFFSEDEFDIARAKAVCGKCGLAAGCLAGALERQESYGVWGGHLLIDGAVVEVKRGRGRPPKRPRPPLVVDEVPVPPHLVA